MLSYQDNKTLTRTGAGTPMGEVLRRYWIPALMSEELPHPDCPQVRVKLLGEELIAFRDTSGRVGLVDEYCPHRRVSLFYGRNEGCGIRCAYHGWKFDVDGKCVDLPSEPTESNFKSKIRIKSYPTEERGGVIWAYMGQPDLKPELPEQEWMLVADSQRYISKKIQECNYFQALEGGIDSSHVSILHSGSVANLGVSRKSSSTTLLARDTAPRFEVMETDYGLLIGARRDADADNYYWRITQFIMPWYTMIPPFGGAPRGGHAWVPMDDEHCWVWSWSWTPGRDLTQEEIDQMAAGAGIHAKLIPGTFRTVANQQNDFLIDRDMQKRGESFAGIFGVGMEDHAVQVSAGAIAERSLERLGTSDTAIIKARRRLLDAVRLNEKGGAVPALDAESHRVRAASVLLPKGMPFHEGAKDALKLMEKDFEAV
ncbi:Rieske 2Fe-2S domain-containing protein [Alicyclobacillus fastidiosus]|uniref:Rieske 2Fe-2S domain-containing protein n=1 Tax=Alicyclobacillus fastidiosus TaxID=392011 RepID=A0ABV5A901_9BACL|nr:Rieske 2Fe-2S domain-containing protein [Alicyclobacillus fastidiosus]WEH10696.1 Rieske 2Fe-2S domain-containing protein [Alicyclobacillus fastidiosus]